MKKFLITAILVVLILSSLRAVWAQNFDFNKSYQDYQYNLTLYNNAFSAYVNAKNAYLQGGQTLQQKSEARQKTLDMLKSRDNLIIVYLAMLRQKIVEDKGLTNDDKGNIFSKIDSETAWYKNHLAGYSDTDELSNLFDKSDEAKERYKSSTILIIYESLTNVGLGEVAGLRLEHEQIYSSLKAVIDTGVASGTLTLNPFNRWFLDIDAADQLLKQKEGEVRIEIQKVYNELYAPQASYDASVEILRTSVSPLLQFNEFLTEVLNYINNQYE